MKSHVDTRICCVWIFDYRFIQSRLIEVRDRVEQFTMTIDQLLFRVLPRRFTRVVYRLPVFIVGELCRVALEASQARAFPGSDVQRQLPNRMSAGNRMCRGV